MKKYLIYMWVFCFSTSCSDFLSVKPENSVTFHNYFETGQDAEAVLNSLMAMMRVIEQFDYVHWGAGLKVDQVSTYWDGYGITRARNLDPRAYTSASWRDLYNLIFSANLLIDNISRCELSEEVKDIYRQQAYFVKGISYFWVGRAWGDAPITDNSMDMGKHAKEPAVKVLEEATTWALKALDLPKYEDLVDYNGDERTTKQYASKGAAAALLANIYAWRASIEKKPEFWREAEKYCTMIIENEVGTYGLAEDPEDVCNRVFRGESEEGIWEIYRTNDYAGEIPETAYTSECMVGWPVRTDAGVSINYPNSAEINRSTVDEMYSVNDLRRQSYFYGIDSVSFHVMMQEYDWETGEVVEVEKEVPYDMEKAFVNVFRFPFYTMNKYDNSKTYVNMAMNKIVWRLADIMLLRAECRWRQGKADAMDDVKKIRERAGLSGAELTDNCQGDVQLAIFREREKELLFEDHRFYDVVRNGMDYIKRELSPVYSNLTEKDIQNGALYYPVNTRSFQNDDLMLQNVYWNTRLN